MLLEYGFKNFFSFKEGAEISFRLDENCPAKISRNKDYSNLLCIKGANGSGKTNILRALYFLGSFCSRSFSADPDHLLLFNSHFDSEDHTEFYAEFRMGSYLYRYELEAIDTEVLRETIYRTKSKKTKILERKLNKITFVSKAFDPLKAIKLRKNASIISTDNQYQLGLLKDLYKFFRNINSNVSYGGLNESLPNDDGVSKFLFQNSEYFDFVKKFISECDVGVTDIELVESKSDDGTVRYSPVFMHGDEPVTKYTESSGTKALFRSLGNYKRVIENGGILVADEFDIHLHPDILPKIINLFEDEKINKKAAQLIFTTHSEEVLNILGRYKTYLVNKENNESYTYRLDEIPGDILRNDRPILPAYRDGKIGGVPKL